MISLTIFVTLFVSSILLAAWTVALAARRVGSPRGRFGIGVLVVLALFVANFTIGALETASLAKSDTSSIVPSLFFLAARLTASFVLIKTIFRLTIGRACAPFGAYIATVVVVIAFVILVSKPYVMETFVQPTEDMTPALDVGNRFAVSRVVRLRRMDLVVFWRDVDGHRLMGCKRVIGLPGERLRFDRGDLFVNGSRIDAPPALAGKFTMWRPKFPADKYRDGETIVLGSDEYFVLGDNVDRSLDSRDHGPVKSSNLVGVVDLIYWPIGKAAILR